jgi:hypothetical protein
MDIKISYHKPEDIAVVGTYHAWDQTANGAPKTIDENSRLFLWPAKVVMDKYNHEFIDVLIAPIIATKQITDDDMRINWPMNDLIQPTDGGNSIRYVLGVPTRIPLNDAIALFPEVASTRGNNSGVYVKN